MKLKFLVAVILLVSVSAFAEIKLGAILAVTGPASFLGMPEKNTLEMLVEEVNAKGGIDGEKVELIVYDTKGSDTEARKKFLRLIQKDDVVAVIGPTTTGESLAIKDLATEKQIPLFTCAASRKIVVPVSKYVFKSPQSDDHAVESIFEYLISKGKKNVAIMTAQNGFGATGRDALLAIAGEYSVNILADEKFRDSDKDMTSQLTKIRDKNPDAVIVWGVGPAPALIAKNFKQLGLKSTLVMSHGVASKKFIELAGDAAEGIILPAGRLLVAEKLANDNKFKSFLLDYKTRYKKKFKEPISTFGGHAYDSFMMFQKGYMVAGKDKTKMVEAVEKVKGMLGTAGEFNFTGSDHNGLTKDAFVILQIKNGGWEFAD